eukprot:10501383-Ditylum_brightwellii.AAC.1
MAAVLGQNWGCGGCRGFGSCSGLGGFVAATMMSLALVKRLFATAVDCCVCCGHGCLGGYGDFSHYSGKWHIPILRLKMASLF